MSLTVSSVTLLLQFDAEWLRDVSSMRNLNIGVSICKELKNREKLTLPPLHIEPYPVPLRTHQNWTRVQPCLVSAS